MTLPKFYPILDAATMLRRGFDPVNVGRQILDAGARILQWREKAPLSRESFEQLMRMASLAQEAGAVFVVNDRADLAKLCGAALHLGQTDLPPSAARRVVGTSTAIGFSTHNEWQLRDASAEPVDYLALGPVFGTASKENPDPVVGLAEFRRLRAWTDRPLVAIGGITRGNAPQVLDAGADSVAIIGDLFPEDGTVGRRVEEWLRICRDGE